MGNGEDKQMSEILGDRAPKGITYTFLKPHSPDWCAYGKHKVNENQHPIFLTYSFRSLCSSTICFQCYVKYPKDNSLDNSCNCR
jgi:hypothetical protein